MNGTLPLHLTSSTIILTPGLFNLLRYLPFLVIHVPMLEDKSWNTNSLTVQSMDDNHVLYFKKTLRVERFNSIHLTADRGPPIQR